MSDVSKQAQHAAQDGDGSLLRQCIQQILSDQDDLSQRIDALDHQDCELSALLDVALEALDIGDFQTRWEIAKLIPGFGAIAIAPLIERLDENDDDDDDWEQIWFIAQILGMFQEPEAIAALIHLIQTATHPDLINIAATALANIGVPALTPLSGLLVAEPTRLPAAQAMAQMQHPQAAKALMAVVRDPNPTIRSAAINALSQIHEPEIPPILVQALTDPSAEVRETAAIGLGLQAKYLNEEPVVEWLEPLLWDLRLEVRCQTAIALGRVGTLAAAQRLSEALYAADTPLPVALEIVRSLLRIDGDLPLIQLAQVLKARSTSFQHLSDADYATLCQAIFTGLGQVGATQGSRHKASQVLIDALAIDSPVTQSPRAMGTIAMSLGYLGQPQAIDSLIQMIMTTEDKGVQLHAMAALKRIDSQKSRQILEQMVYQDHRLPDDVRANLAIALQEWDLQ